MGYGQSFDPMGLFQNPVGFREQPLMIIYREVGQFQNPVGFEIGPAKAAYRPGFASKSKVAVSFETAASK
ncbi:hypothetical protein LQZ21_09710 [Treponema sp. TIM-1]|uniref:hypothetical protein n=1 Tax=Treponema sp. TIM-1 TaxID=2898417 RepID=UPI003980EE8F